MGNLLWILEYRRSTRLLEMNEPSHFSEFPSISFPHICNGNSNTASYNLGSLERRLSSLSVQEFIRDQYLWKGTGRSRIGHREESCVAGLKASAYPIYIALEVKWPVRVNLGGTKIPELFLLLLIYIWMWAAPRSTWPWMG